ncbi:unnamed protein product [Musa banksii]
MLPDASPCRSRVVPLMEPVGVVGVAWKVELPQGMGGVSQRLLPPRSIMRGQPRRSFEYDGVGARRVAVNARFGAVCRAGCPTWGGVLRQIRSVMSNQFFTPIKIHSVQVARHQTCTKHMMDVRPYFKAHD